MKWVKAGLCTPACKGMLMVSLGSVWCIWTSAAGPWHISYSFIKEQLWSFLFVTATDRRTHSYVRLLICSDKSVQTPVTVHQPVFFCFIHNRVIHDSHFKNWAVCLCLLLVCLLLGLRVAWCERLTAPRRAFMFLTVIFLFCNLFLSESKLKNLQESILLAVLFYFFAKQ